ncbi:MAG: tetratricopeptide repeat protein [Elusimicrobia bacterium]|nr:tetratricopeptide repeat protein [Elusimicrobiota bacterium]
MPGVSQDLMKEGLELAKEGKNELALQTLQQATEADSANAAAYTALGMVALQSQRFDLAQPALERAIAIDPKSQTALYSLGMLYEKLKRYPEARYAWQRFLNLSPSADLADLARRHLERLP